MLCCADKPHPKSNCAVLCRAALCCADKPHHILASLIVLLGPGLTAWGLDWAWRAVHDAQQAQRAVAAPAPALAAAAAGPAAAAAEALAPGEYTGVATLSRARRKAAEEKAAGGAVGRAISVLRKSVSAQQVRPAGPLLLLSSSSAYATLASQDLVF